MMKNAEKLISALALVLLAAPVFAQNTATPQGPARVPSGPQVFLWL